MITTLLGIGSTIRWSDWRDEILYDGQVWEPHAFDVRKAMTGRVNDTMASVVCEDSENSLSQLSASGGITGEICQILFVKYESGQWVENTEYSQIELSISGCLGQYPDVTIELSARYGWKRSGGIPAGDKACKHVFKGLRCQYAGVDTSCPRDREHCRTVKLNLENFGGFHFARDAGSTISLGRVRYTIQDRGGAAYPGYLGGDPGIEEDPDPTRDFEPVMRPPTRPSVPRRSR